jgi:hypothetical protein
MRKNLLGGAFSRSANLQLFAMLSPAAEQIVRQQAANSDQSMLQGRWAFAG